MTNLNYIPKISPLEEVVKYFNKKKNIPTFRTYKPIDIVIPVYNGFDFLKILLNSIIKNTTMNYRILICDDKSTDKRVIEFLKEFKSGNSNKDILIFENKQNLGFVKTVNLLVKHTNNHFVLLNTDTQLPPFWIERLMFPIFKMKNISSTTPFTNSGTICSFPNYLEDNPIFENMDVADLDNYFQYLNINKTLTEIPTGVGFCMGINKNVVNEIGMFDEVFGKGYVEENDWCQRAIKKGYKNLHVTNLFVYHKHGGSFDPAERKKLIENNLSLLAKRHPTYLIQVAEFIKFNSLESLRDFLKVNIYYSIKNNCKLIIDNHLDKKENKNLSKEDSTIFLNYNSLENKFYLKFHYKSFDIIYELDNLLVIEMIFKLIPIKNVFINKQLFNNNYKNLFYLQKLYKFNLDFF